MIEKVKTILIETLNKPELQETVNESTNLMADLGTDSLQLIDFMLAIEDEYDVEFDFDNFDISHFYSLKAFTAFVERLRDE